VDVIIIGAGAAGLAAATALRNAGIEALLLEARSRAGGRAWTVRHEGTNLPIELGAEFVHGSARATERLAATAGSLIIDVEGAQWRADDGRLERADDFWDAVGAVLGRIDPDAPDRSFAAFLRRRPGGQRLAQAREYAHSFVQGFHAADIEHAGVRGIVAGGVPGRDAEAERHGRLSAGYGALVEQLVRGCSGSIRYGAVVERVDWRRGGADILLAGGETLQCRAVVITVPLPLLQSRALVLEPEPTAVRRALDNLVMGSVVRVSLLFEDRFWEDDVRAGDEPLVGLGFLHTPQEPFNIWWTPHPVRGPLLTGWSGGPAATALARSGNVGDAALRSLARALGMSRRRLAARLIATFTHDWGADPFSRGAYSYAAVGGAEAAARLARPVQGTVFLAGEATASEDSGTVEGALGSGRRAARQVQRALG
jgi:monoamine oxidase